MFALAIDCGGGLAVTKAHVRGIGDAQAVVATVGHDKCTAIAFDGTRQLIIFGFALHQIATIDRLFTKTCVNPVQQFEGTIQPLAYAKLKPDLVHVLLAVLLEIGLVIDALIAALECRFRRRTLKQHSKANSHNQTGFHDQPPDDCIAPLWRGAVIDAMHLPKFSHGLKPAAMLKPANVHRLAELSATQRQALITRTETDLSSFTKKVKPIMAAVRDEGDVALARFARQFDKAPVKTNAIAATPEDFARAGRTLAPAMHEAMAFAADSISRFHSAQMPQMQWMMEVRPGVFAGDRTTAIASVACYVPRGKGSFPSSVLMTAIPATVAGVENICIITPPGPDGEIDDATLVAARLAGVSKVYKAGGAQAIAAVTYGTQTISPVRKIVGPGSPWVAAAKRLVADLVDVGTPAGPSETIVMADATTSGRLAALDLLIETEHGPDSSGYLVTWDEAVAHDALAAFADFYTHMSALRVDYAQTVLSGPLGGVILARDEDDAISFINAYAPEHLQILSKEPKRYLDRIKHAGEILLGEHAPSTLANFVVGPSHVLPTGGWAQTGSALSVHDFLKRTSVVDVTKQGYATLAPHAKIFAEYEGFDAHANAVSKLRDGLTGN
jgi:histidinol dehydrogenase